MKRLDLTGQRYGSLVAIKRLPSGSISRWLFKCDCGKETDATLGNVRSGQIQSCGCLGSRRAIGQMSVKHGHSRGFRKTKTLAAWRNAKTRCFNENSDRYPDYGGRGITMCKEWADDFRAFLRDMGECPDGLSLDRKDFNGNYEPGNCRWITMQEQSENTRSNVFVETNAGRVILKRFAEANGVEYKYLHRRVKILRETPEEALKWFEAKGKASKPAVLNITVGVAVDTDK